MDFVIGQLVFTNQKGKTYDSILVIVNRLIKMIYYKPVKVTINAQNLAEVIIQKILRHNDVPDLIVNDWGSVFILKFWSSLCNFFGIKQKLWTAFYLQTDG